MGGSLVSMLEKVFGGLSPSQMTLEEGRSWASYTLAVVGFRAHFRPNLLSLLVSVGSPN